MNRQKLILFLLLIVFVGAVVYAYVKSPKPQRVAKLKYAPGAVASAPRPKAPGAAKGTQSAPPPAAAAIPAAPTAPAAAPPQGGATAPATAAPATAAPATAAPATAAPATAPAGTAGAAAPRLPGTGAQIANDDSRVHLELLDQAKQFSGYRRNIFSPIFREELKAPPMRTLPPLPARPTRQLPPPPPPKAVAGAAPSPLPVQPAPPPPPTAEQLADQELSKFTFLGFLKKKNGDKTVFLSKNNEIILAKKGSKIGPNFVVSDLTDDALTIRSIPEGRELVIPLVENRGLSTRHTR
jgi:hypothetical protein